MTLRIMAGEIGTSERAYVLLVKPRVGIVVLIRESTHLINVVPGGNIQARAQKSSRKPTDSAEEVNRGRGLV